MITRRQMLKTTAASGALCFAASLPGVKAASHATAPLRRSLQGMAQNDPIIEAYREFVDKMKNPTAGQAINWVQFADIHGTATGGFNLCPHRNWYFLPWHRGYLRMYEVAVRELTGMTDFAMPYWDWTDDPGFPAHFGDEMVNGQPNALFVPGRSTATGDMIPVGNTGQAVMDTIYGMQTFEEFGTSRPAGQTDTDPSWVMSTSGTSGELEANPHNSVHCIVRGPFMCAAPSPQDPVFMMHHGNIDRVWAVWIEQGRTNSPDPLWLNMELADNFLNPDGSPVTEFIKVADLQEVEPLGYTYGLNPPEKPPIVDPGRYFYLAALYGGGDATMGLGFGREVQRAGMVAPDAPLSVSLTTPNVSLSSVLDTSASGLDIRGSGASLPTVYAFVRGVMPVSGDDTQVRVFVNLPEANADTQTAGNPHYVSTIGFFGHMSGHGGQNVAVDLTPALKALRAAGMGVGDDVTVQLVAAPTVAGAEPANVTVAEVELAVV